MLLKDIITSSTARYKSVGYLTMGHMTLRCVLLAAVFAIANIASAQIGEHRNVFSVGVNGGLVMSNVGFTPEVSQSQHMGATGGLTFRYTTEKYFSTICSLQAEINYASLGWKENIVDADDQKVINATTGKAEEYSRTISYVQVPLMAHLAWGKEEKGLNFFLNLGPQFGYMLSESSACNFDMQQEIAAIAAGTSGRGNTNIAQDTLEVKNKLDYGIAAGIGVECSARNVGHFLIEARYYYGLGNIFGASKKDYFGKSNYGNIVIKASWLFDITKTKH